MRPINELIFTQKSVGAARYRRGLRLTTTTIYVSGAEGHHSVTMDYIANNNLYLYVHYYDNELYSRLTTMGAVNVSDFNQSSEQEITTTCIDTVQYVYIIGYSIMYKHYM